MPPAPRSPAVIGRPVDDPANWLPNNLAQDPRWRFELTNAEIDDLHTMATRLGPRLGGDPNRLLDLTASDFNLGRFGKRLEQLRSELKDGFGVALIRGLSLDKLSRLEAATIYWAIGSHLGQARSNNPDGDMLGHVTDLGKSQDDPNSRGYQTRETMDYHCDQASIVGLLCVQEPKSGGLSKIASAVAVYNALLQRAPETVELLSRKFCWTKHGETDDGEQAYYESPVFSILDDKLCVSFGPRHIIKGHDLPGAPALSSAQAEAIRITEELAEELHYSMQLQRGDMQFLNNFVVLHTRTAYIDWSEPGKQRLLWRLWLSAPDLRSPTDYVKQWDAGVSLSRTQPRIVL